MRSKQKNSKVPAERVVKYIRRARRKPYSAEEKIRIVLEGLRGDDSLAELYRREGIAQLMRIADSQKLTPHQVVTLNNHAPAFKDRLTAQSMDMQRTTLIDLVERVHISPS